MDLLLNTYLSLGMSMMDDIESRSDDWKKRILAEFNASKNYPRKKKKRVRKELQLNWNIANWNPFDYNF